MAILAQTLGFDKVWSVTDCDGDGLHTQQNGTLQEILEEELAVRYGPLFSGNALGQILGYTSNDACRQALSRKTIPIPVFLFGIGDGEICIGEWGHVLARLPT